MTKPDYLDSIEDGTRSIALESAGERAKKTNDIQLKLRELIQKDEQKNINKHSEGYCYGCTRKDYIISSLFYCCQRCMEKRGKECLLALVYQKPSEELCDFCGKWSKPYECWQINVSLCDSCMFKVKKFHNQYRKGGGREKQNPYYQRLRKKNGKDWKQIMYDGFARKLPI